MSYYTNYIGYKQSGKQIGFGVPVTTAATGGVIAPVTLIVDAAIALLPALIPWIKGIFKSPTKDALRMMNDLKPKLVNIDVRERLGLIIAAGKKVSRERVSVEARSVLLWYRENYPNDYKTLPVEDKQYFNNYILSIKRSFPDGDDMYKNLDKAMFTNEQINFNASPLQGATDILSNLTKSPSTLLLYGGIGVGLFYLLKKKK